MKLLSSLVALALVGALSVWLWSGQGPSVTVADGVAVSPEAVTTPAEQGVIASEPEGREAGDTEPQTSAYAAALVGLQAAIDLWAMSPGALGDTDRISDAIGEARDAADDEAATQEEVERERRDTEEQQPQPVSPRPVSPPSYDCEWDDDEWDCDDDDDWDDDDWDDDDDDDDWDDWDDD